MNVPVNIQLGINGLSRPMAPIWLDVDSVGAAAEWCGSFHVLGMGQHYDEYVVTPRTFLLPPIPGFPTAHPYERLAGKIRDAGVTGNIGEAVAALFARRYLQAPIDTIAHLRPRRPFRRRRTPDYLMRIGSLIPSCFGPILPASIPLQWPDWWPVESKARSTDAGCRSVRVDALRQLVTYWSLLVRSRPDLAGYGIIVTFTYHLPREIRVSLIIPRDATALAATLRDRGDDMQDTELRGHLHVC